MRTSAVSLNCRDFLHRFYLKLQRELSPESSVGKARPAAWLLLGLGVLLVPVCLVNWVMVNVF